MATIKIYGASDDLIEVEGDVPGCNEFNSFDAPLFIELGTADVFKVEYTAQGVWVITHQEKGALRQLGSVLHEPHGDGEDPEPHTDIVTISGPIGWVEAWESYPPTVNEKRGKLGRLLADDEDGFDRDRLLSDEDIGDMWKCVARALRRKK
jgi:hypothetical protein